MKILIITSTQNAGEAIQAMIQMQFPHSEVELKNLENGRKTLEKEHVDIVLCDRAFERTNDDEGLKIFALIKEVATIFVLMTSFINNEDLRRYEKIGIRYVIEKPLDMSRLTQLLTILVKKPAVPETLQFFPNQHQPATQPRE